MKKEYIVAMAILVLAVAFYLNPMKGSESSDATIKYHSSVCKVVTRVDGTVEDLGCGPNLVVNGGLDFINSCIGKGLCGTPTNFSIIALGGNTTPQAATDTTLANEWATNGLSRAAATYTYIGTGNWSITKTWTDTTAASVVNTTGLFNATSSGTLFAENYFTPVTLQIADQLNVTWTIWVTSS
jgi:hypothetical protein